MNAEYIQEPERTLPVRYADYDVVVAGGGIAGIAAALAAARAGKRVVLLERMFALGGLATLGLVTIYLPLCDGKGHQLSFGLAEELLKLSIREGWERDYPDTWLSGSTEHGRQRYKVRYNAQVFAILAEQLLAGENVKILYGTTVCQVLRSGSRLTHIIVENKDGRFAIPVRSAVDATGDADLFHQAAAPVRLKRAICRPHGFMKRVRKEMCSIWSARRMSLRTRKIPRFRTRWWEGVSPAWMRMRYPAVRYPAMGRALPRF